MQNKSVQILDRYLQKHGLHERFIDAKPNNNLGLIVVIPCYNEPNIIRTLQSIENCDKPKSEVEIITIINSHQNTDNKILTINKQTEAIISDWNLKSRKFSYHTIHVKDIPTKYAGVGYVRKLGIDEAIRRFIEVKNSDGIICSLDADTTVAPNYFTEIEKKIGAGSKYNACAINFEHDIRGNEFTDKVYDIITDYELHIRYYSKVLKHIGFPHYFHTIGSAFAVSAEAYCRQGGMNKKQAGEDFYFLQKIMQMYRFCELNTTTVYPSSRPSDRVVFGTGPVIRTHLEQDDYVFLSYNFDAFIALKQLFDDKMLFFKVNNDDFNEITAKYHKAVRDFLRLNNFKSAIDNINANVAKIENFNRKFFHWFDGFRVVKYLNFAHENYFEKTPIKNCIIHLLSTNNKHLPSIANNKDMLIYLRKLYK